MTKKFEIPITNEDRCEVEMEIDRGQMVSFVIRYDGFIDGRWRNIAVFDTHGGSAHWHLVDPILGKREKQPIPLDLKQVVTYAIDTIKHEWEEMRAWYLRRLTGHDQQNLF
ncbi:MAG TPA: hypothetical protein VN494_11240 [Patescibacteria group bacterium]|nr:hypothetical protein [Patescibacteria group bacterium]